MRVAIYLRVSTSEQAEEGFSISAQKERLRAYVQSQGWTISSIYEDAGFSGGSFNRPAFTRMREDMKRDAFDLLLVYKLDRLSRNMRDLSNLIHEMDNSGIYFKSATEPFDTTTPAGKLIFNMLGSVAEFERGMIAERVRMGMTEKAREGGGLLGFSHPYGYRISDGELRVIEDEARNVRGIYRRCIMGLSLGEIAEELNSAGIQSKKGGKWRKQPVSNILHNPLYAGFMRWAGIYWKGTHQPIVNAEEWNDAQRMLSYRSRSCGSYFTIKEEELVAFNFRTEAAAGC